MRTLVGHKLAILVLCQVGKSTVWSGSEDNLIKVWSVLDVSLRRTLSGHAGPVCSLVQMGPHVWSGSADCTILVWDASSHALLFSLGHQGGYALLENVCEDNGESGLATVGICFRKEHQNLGSSKFVGGFDSGVGEAEAKDG